MKVILNKDWSNLGEEGDVVDVKVGYARNFLIPKGIALLDSPAARSYFKAKAKEIEKRKEEKKEKSKSIKDRLSSLELKLVMATADNDKLFASVSPSLLQDKLKKDFDIELERKKISVDSKNIKTPGTYSFTVSLYQGDTCNVKLVIEAEKKPVKLTEKELKGKPRRQKRDVEEPSQAAETESKSEAVPSESK